MCVFVRIHILLGGSSASTAGNHTFWGTLLPQKPKIGRIGQRACSVTKRVIIVIVVEDWKWSGKRCADVNVTLEMRRSWNIARRVDVGSACVDVCQSPPTYLFAYLANSCDVDVF